MAHMTRSPNSTPALWRQQQQPLHNYSPISDPTHNHPHRKMPMRAATAQSSHSSGDGVLLKEIKDSEQPNNKRMSRASKKKTPTKYLNATAKNFKSLVHKHTACPPTPPPFSLIGGSGKFRGPVTISFDQGLGYYHQEQAGESYAHSNQAILNNAGVIDQINTTPSVVGFSWSSSSSVAYDDQYNKAADYAVVESTTTASPDCFDPHLGMPTTDAAAGLDQENADDDGFDWFDFVAEFFSADGIL